MRNCRTPKAARRINLTEKVSQAVQDMKTNYKSMKHLQEHDSPDEIATMALKENGLFQKMTEKWSTSLEKEYKKATEPAEYRFFVRARFVRALLVPARFVPV